MSSPDPIEVRALALSEMYEQVIPALFKTLEGIRFHVDQVLDRQSVTREDWRLMGVGEREAILRRDRKETGHRRN